MLTLLLLLEGGVGGMSNYTPSCSYTTELSSFDDKHFVRVNSSFLVSSLLHFNVAFSYISQSTIRGYPSYKTITPQNMLSEAQVKNFFIS